MEVKMVKRIWLMERSGSVEAGEGWLAPRKRHSSNYKDSPIASTQFRHSVALSLKRLRPHVSTRSLDGKKSRAYAPVEKNRSRLRSGVLTLLKTNGEEDHCTSDGRLVTRYTAILTYFIGLCCRMLEPWKTAVVVGRSQAH